MQSLGPTTAEHQEDMEKWTGKMPGKQKDKIRTGMLFALVTYTKTPTVKYSHN